MPQNRGTRNEQGAFRRLLVLCGPVGIRTPNLLIRSQMLYPIELRVLKSGANIEIDRHLDCVRLNRR